MDPPVHGNKPLDPVSPDERFKPQSLPTEDALNSTDPMGIQDPDEKMKRLERETEINTVNPKPETNTGPDTVGVGQPPLQPVNQGQSLPQSAIPVEKKFEGKTDQFYDPMEAERAAGKKNRSDTGGQKANF